MGRVGVIAFFVAEDHFMQFFYLMYLIKLCCNITAYRLSIVGRVLSGFDSFWQRVVLILLFTVLFWRNTVNSFTINQRDN